MILLKLSWILIPKRSLSSGDWSVEVAGCPVAGAEVRADCLPPGPFLSISTSKNNPINFINWLVLDFCEKKAGAGTRRRCFA